jgi:hypothetical protein
MGEEKNVPLCKLLADVDSSGNFHIVASFAFPEDSKKNHRFSLKKNNPKFHESISLKGNVDSLVKEWKHLPLGLAKDPYIPGCYIYTLPPQNSCFARVRLLIIIEDVVQVYLMGEAYQSTVEKVLVAIGMIVIDRLTMSESPNNEAFRDSVGPWSIEKITSYVSNVKREGEITNQISLAKAHLTRSVQRVMTPIPHTDKRIIVVVNLAIDGDFDDIFVDHLNWLSSFFASFDPWNCRLVIIGKYFIKNTHQFSRWVAFADWQDLYTKLMTGGYFYNDNKRTSFDFGLFLNMREDGKPGFGYGRSERCDERCILRGLFLAARGNVLFGEWGCPEDFKLDVTHEELRLKCVMHTYLYAETGLRWYPDQSYYNVNRPVLFFLNHFLQPIALHQSDLPEDSIKRIQQGIEGTLFTRQELRRAYCKAYVELYFADDGWRIHYHQWPMVLRPVQLAGIQMYVTLRSWQVSSTWAELAVDYVSLFFSMGVYTLLTGAFSAWWKEESMALEDPRAWLLGSSSYLTWLFLWPFLLKRQPYVLEGNDRFSAKLMLEFFLSFAIVFTGLETLRTVWWSNVNVLGTICLNLSIWMIDFTVMAITNDANKSILIIRMVAICANFASFIILHRQQRIMLQTIQACGRMIWETHVTNMFLLLVRLLQVNIRFLGSLWLFRYDGRTFGVFLFAPFESAVGAYAILSLIALFVYYAL